MPTLFLPGNRSIITRNIPTAIAIAIFLLLPASKGLVQEEISPLPVTPQTSAPEEIPSDGLFFADVIVRGQPVFQIGSLGELSATERAQIVNRRIAGILAQSQTGSAVTVVPDPGRGIATLQVNNRVLMTVTQQDAQDFNLPVDKLAQQWAAELNQAFERPPLAIDVGQRLWITLRQFQRDAIDNLPAFLGALLAIAVAWLIAASLRRLTLVGAQRWEVDRNSKILVSRLVYFCIMPFWELPESKQNPSQTFLCAN
ncbi:hypothetical protein [Chroococcidiopsis thermalis]|uniref:hypothetical protein n=1 Tax=Chroococcidiopsis thermalis TaxID=54299 RepID=UPI0002F35C82|nr:hypothetical protein [Chroococcidiopsis thermalis]